MLFRSLGPGIPGFLRRGLGWQWGVVPSGKPMKFKSRRKVTKEESLKTWNQLLSSNWVEFDFDKHMTA